MLAKFPPSRLRGTGPEQKREHLHAFWRDVVGGRPVVVVGTSLGGTIAMDFALHYPHAVERLVLVDAQVSAGWRAGGRAPLARGW